MTADLHWQVQQVKQRLSEVLRAAETDGVQYVTRHGKDVAVVMSIEEYRTLSAPEPRRTFNELLLAFPKLGLTDDEIDALFARSPELESHRDTPFVGPDWE
jgi:prevent-host-death family protein